MLERVTGERAQKSRSRTISLGNRHVNSDPRNAVASEGGVVKPGLSGYHGSMKIFLPLLLVALIALVVLLLTGASGTPRAPGIDRTVAGVQG